MGVYNTVKLNPPEICPKCGQAISEWQSKSMAYAGYDLANVLRELKLNKNMDGEIHTTCPKCKTFISLEIKKGKVNKST